MQEVLEFIPPITVATGEGVMEEKVERPVGNRLPVHLSYSNILYVYPQAMVGSESRNLAVVMQLKVCVRASAIALKSN